MSEMHNACGMIVPDTDSTLWRTQNISKGLPTFWKPLTAIGFLRMNDHDLNFREIVSQYPVWNRPNVCDDWNELPVQVWCRILVGWGWCTGTTQRDGMGREEGGGFRMGNTCIPVADSFWYLAKLTQLCKV